MPGTISWKSQSLDRPKIPRFYSPPPISNNKYVFDNILHFVGCIYVSRFVDFKDLSRYHYPICPFFFKTIEIEDCVGPTRKTRFNVGVPPPPRLSIFQKFGFPKRCDMQNHYLLKAVWYFLSFLPYFGNNQGAQGSRGSDLVNTLNVPKMSNKNIGICPQALISHFKLIINHKTPKTQ